MPWISSKRLHELEQNVESARAAEKLAKAERRARDVAVMSAFTTLWPKHAKSLRNLTDPNGYREQLAGIMGMYGGGGDLSTECLDTLIETANVERKRRDAERIERAETRRIDALRHGTAKSSD